MPGSTSDDVGQARALAAREVVLRRIARDDDLRAEAEAREEHLHLLGRGVLGLVEDDERVVERAPAHEGERRDLDHALLHVGRQAVGVEHVVERVEERPKVGIDLREHVAGQESEPLAGLDGRAREDDARDLAVVQRRDGERHREIGLAGARRADAERHGRAADRVDVALLVERLGRDLLAAVPPHDVVQDVDRAPVRVEHADDRIDRLLPDRQALLDEAGELLEQQAHLCHGRVTAFGDDLVAAQRDARAGAFRDGLEQAVAVGAQLLGERVVDRECERGHTPMVARCAPRSVPTLLARRARTRSCTRLPSARPAASAIASRMTWPISRWARGADLRDRALDDDLEILVGELRGQVALDQLGLALLGGRAVGVAGVVEGLAPPRGAA